MISNVAREFAANAGPTVSMVRTQYGSFIEKTAGSPCTKVDLRGA